MKVQTVWDAYKATMRGYLIQQNSIRNRKKNQEMNAIKMEIEKKEKELKEKPDNNTTRRELDLLKHKKHSLEMDQMAKQLKYIKQDFFENANKIGKWLARKIRKKKQAQQIVKIKQGPKILTKENEIMEEFMKFYKQLYKKENIDKGNIGKFLSKLKLEKINDEQRLSLNKEITTEEIEKAIKNLHNNKSPGPDGYTAVLYKTLQEELIPVLRRIMNKALMNEELPESWKQGEIILIQKENTNPEEIKNYRPITLLNTDYKIFASILANRFKGFLKEWVKDDQNGFLPNRSIKDNMRVILDTLEFYETHHQRELALLSIDAEKAFDKVNWEFFKALFKEIDIGHQFQNAINAIYGNQRARLIINNNPSQEITIEKGTRQGCPLSPLIFIFALETLLKNIREDPELVGLKINKQEFKIKAYADDVICIVENPRKNITKWLSKIEEYGEIAGFKINKTKSKILTKNISKKNQESLEELSNIKIVGKIKYLGIWITSRNMHLLKNNYGERWKGISKDLKNWRHLNLSLLGRIAAVKMNILPKMLFLFQNLPIIRNEKIFKDWKKEIMKFIWNNKRPRIKYTIMIDSKKRGGFGLPDLKLYYESCALMWIKDWANLKNEKTLLLEGFDLYKGWHSYLWYDRAKREKNFGNHFIRSSLLKVWMKYKRLLHIKTPMWVSPLEANQRRLLGWNKWPTYNDILIKKEESFQIKSQEEIRQRFNNVSWYQYRQIQEYFNIDKQMGFSDKREFWDAILTSDRKVITRVYEKLNEWATQTEQIKNTMISWARNIGRPIYLKEWEQIWTKRLKYTYAIDLKENWIKMLHRWYITPKKIGIMYKNADQKCWKCKLQDGTFYHMWWSCDKTATFWRLVHTECKKILKTDFPMRPEIYLLGMFDLDFFKDTNIDKLFTFLATAARLVFAKVWKQETIPTKESWLDKVMEIRNMDKLTYLMRQSNGKGIKKTDWSMVDNYLKEGNKTRCSVADR
uniref:Reverse transcriptase domain-containing protein n=1 Tax=Anolis carolinensis TaxID=28377 RepID=A0A803SRX2_ANOCA